MTEKVYVLPLSALPKPPQLGLLLGMLLILILDALGAVGAGNFLVLLMQLGLGGFFLYLVLRLWSWHIGQQFEREEEGQQSEREKEEKRAVDN
jgi:membrane protein implicated in regulation of membrane protease activity